MGATYLDEEGQAQPILMGSYGIGLGRLLASIAEEHFDENGLVWPISVAPFQIHLLDLRGGQETAHGLYETFLEKGFEVLYDDRDERPGVKFNDADLIGIPLRLTVSKRSLENGGVEFKARDQDEVMIIPLEKVLPEARSQILDRERALNARVVKMPYKS
jgi:prolyl-tRNA synthetase